MNEETVYYYPQNPEEFVTKYRKYDMQEILAEGYFDLEDKELMETNLEYSDMSIHELREWVDDVFCHEGDEHIEGALMTEEELVECLTTCDFYLIEI